MTAENRKRRYGRFINRALIVSDFFVVNIVLGIVLWLNPHAWDAPVRMVVLLANVSFVPVVWLAYGTRVSRSLRMERNLLAALKATTLFILWLFAFLYIFDITAINPYVYLELFLGVLIGLPVWWAASRLLIKQFRRKGRNYSSVVIIGTAKAAQQLYQQMKADAGFGYNVFGFFDDRKPASGFPWPQLYMGGLDRLDAFLQTRHIDEIYFAQEHNDPRAMQTAIRAAESINASFIFVPQLNQYMLKPFTLNSIGSMQTLMLTPGPLSNVFNRAVKRMMDLAISGTFLLVSPIIFIPIAIGVKLSSSGPVFFRQKRTGYRGREFVCLKFRTMRVNTDSDKVRAGKDDPRKTRFGDFLRRTSLDELPQFINVFRGDMSIVGPRPHMLAHTEEYSRLIDKYTLRHNIKPGITGWAQVNGYRGSTPHLWQMEARVRYDMWYIENWDWMLDIKIMLRTIINGLKGEENAF